MTDFATAIADPSLDLRGGVLVEASAGTGKTYNIQNVYLRLVVTEGLRVQSILTVTFTEAATQELRARLRDILACCDRCLSAGGPLTAPPDAVQHDRIGQILRLPLTTPDGGATPADVAAEQRRRVRLALMDFDSAAIFTIHGFCNRVLERYAFECGHDPDAELIPVADELVADLCRDWWRRHAYTPDGAAGLPFKDAAELILLTREAAARPDALLRPSLSAELASAAERTFADAVAAGLKAMPTAEATNAVSRAIEEALREATPRSRGGVVLTLYALRRCAETVIKGLEGSTKPSWLRPGGRHSKDKIGLAERLPGAEAGCAAALKGIQARMASVAGELRDQLQQRVRDRGAITYDAMLLRVRDALRDGHAGARLLTVLRAEFQAALVDEFQDTDPVQYESFRRIFLEGTLPLLFVGDPKQAIYGFRGGDIFAYYGARGQIPETHRFALRTNYRSEAAMVAAVNEFFHDCPDAPVFATSQIAYSAVAAGDLDPARRLTDCTRPETDPQPLKLWRYAAEDAAMPGERSAIARRMCRDVAGEVVRLLNDEGLHLRGRRLHPSDIAILVCTHSEAAMYRDELAGRGVNAVRQAQDNVFDTAEARDLLLLMQAMLAPGDMRALRAALCAGLLPCSRADLRRFDSLDGWLDRFRTAGACWRQHSFVEAFDLLAGSAGLFAHVARSGGTAPEERLASIRQLVELAHGAAVRNRFAPEALLRWCARQCDEAARDADEAFKRRPASDDEAVRIMTVFKSKGLEFPVVFVPTLWRRPARQQVRSAYIAYHDEAPAARGFDRILDLDRTARARAEQERLEENVRLIYVALTRAVNRAYLLAVDGAGEADDYALGMLTSRWDAWRRSADPPPASAIVEVTRSGTDTDDAPRFQALPPADLAGPYRDGRALVDKRHGHASFTSLTPHDRVEAGAAARDVDADDETRAPVESPTDDIFLFPGGARTGDCWHGLFETLDFQADAAARARTIDETLDRFNLCDARDESLRLRRRAAVHAMVARVLEAPLPCDGAGFTLGGVPLAARRAELDFQFPLQRRDPSRELRALAGILDRHWRTSARNESFLASLAQADRALPLGFMTGAIDLLFEHDGRFYIVDWKSNRLDGRRESFRAPGLAREMATHAYYLQYLIYAVAVQGFLRQTLRGYRHTQHFGGIFYLFLRGVDGGGGGIFHDCPSAACLDALARFLMPEELK
ncbi:MAG: UvrD-helicase domain-containing protein [Kiritimatiellae bacterium]|nr:UvrD-helicase domain-containing protein [Kiritimatiellia bacterium]